MGSLVGTAPDHPATTQPARRADVEAPAERGPAAGVVRLSAPQRRQLALLVHDPSSAWRHGFASSFGRKSSPRSTTVGLAPQNLPERVARKKLIEELLDQMGERGFLTMGDLRDAISRNNLKLPDLAKPARFFPWRPTAASRPGLGADARRRLSARRILLAMDAAIEFVGVWHARPAAF